MTTRRAQVVGQPHAQRQFLEGIHIVADLLAPTLGPLGGHVAGSTNANTSRLPLLTGVPSYLLLLPLYTYFSDLSSSKKDARRKHGQAS